MSITTNRVEPALSGSRTKISTELPPDSPRPELTNGDLQLHMRDGQVCIQHANGGGLVALTARVESTVFVAETAAVLGHAVVRGDVRVEDQAVIQDNARVTGRTRLRHESRVGDDALLEGRILMQRHSMVGGRAHLRGMISMDYHAYVGDRSRLFGNMHLE
jgi:acyl-[acyl carrier protein]--UDP-N-acetylglucosamine O-acyltransferase